MNTLTLYEQYEKQSRTVHNRRCIDGKITGSNNCVGYCKYSEHSGFLTTKQRKEHKCIEKECFYYIAKERTPKSTFVTQKESVENFMETASDCTREYEGLKVLHAIPNGSDSWVLRYIAISNDYPISVIENKISKTTGCAIILERLNYDFDVCVKLLLAV